MALWAGDEFLGVYVPNDNLCMIPELLVDFVKNQDWSESSDAHWFLGRLGLDLGRAVYWWRVQDNLQEAGIKVVWYDSY